MAAMSQTARAASGWRLTALDRWYGPAVSAAAVIAALVLWEIAAGLGWLDVRFTSRPSAIWSAALAIIVSGELLFHASVSFTAFATGFVMAVVVGVPLGVFLGTSRIGRLFLEPPLMALYTTPRLSLLPILIVWLGIGLASKVAIVFLGALFPIMINAMAGVRSADHRLINAARAFGATYLDIFVKVLIPGSLPAILMGVRLGIGRGVLSVVVGEMFVSEAGIGYQIMSYGQAMQFNKLLVYAFAISLFGYVLTVAVRVLEDSVRSWKPAS